MQQPVGEDMAPLGICAELRLVDRDEGEIAVGRHGFGGAQEPAGLIGKDLLLAGDQRHLPLTLDRHHPVIDFPGEESQRKADHAAGMTAHSLDCEMRLARVGRAEHGCQHIGREAGHGANIGAADDKRKRLLSAFTHTVHGKKMTACRSLPNYCAV